MLRYLIKLKVLFLILILVVFLVTVACNILLSVSRPSIIKSLNKYFSQSISIENAIFVPPNFIFLKNISISEAMSPEDTQLSFIPAIFIKLSLPKLLFKKTLTLSAISLYNPRMQYADFCNFIKENYKQIIDFIRSLPEENFKFQVNQARLGLVQKNNKSASILADFGLSIKDRFMIGSGSIKKGELLHYKFSGSLLEDSFFLQNLELIKNNLYSQLSGEIHKDSLKISGLAFIDTLFRQQSDKKSEADIVEKITSFLRRTPKYPDAIFLSQADLKIFDIDCQVNFSFPQVEIEKLYFTLNKVPFALKGDFSFSQPLSLDLILSSYPGKTDDLSGEDIKKLDLSIKGSLDEQAFSGDSSFSLNFVKKKNIRTPLEKVKFSLKNLVLDFTGYPQPKLSAGEIDLLCQTESSSYKLFLQDLQVDLDLNDEYLKSFVFNSSFYDGNLGGSGRINIRRFPPRITSSLTIEDASANKLEELLEYFSKVDGKLASSMTFSNYPGLNLNGLVNVQGG
ncbi:MAG: AsmA family protein, partial [Candidatus Omnitrophica bacterium]|nr:AsmA family protein [Candidatus Omnitrophota bacterium]